MEFSKVLQERRSYRALKHFPVSDDLVRQLAQAASLAPSCYNNQPWRFVFVKAPAVLTKLGSALAKGNEWVEKASLIIAVFSRKDLDCVIKDRIYYMLDTGIGTGFLLLKAWDLGLVAHPIAGFDDVKVKKILNIPQDMDLPALIAVSRHAPELANEKQAEEEAVRPPRKPFEQFASFDVYKQA